MKRAPAVALLACLLVSIATACYRTRYVNLPLVSQLPQPSSETQPPPSSGWHNFFVYGWAPGERVIDASAACGGADKVESVETRRRFVQGLIATFAGYSVVNIYSPYEGKVICEGRIKR